MRHRLPLVKTFTIRQTRAGANPIVHCRATRTVPNSALLFTTFNSLRHALPVFTVVPLAAVGGVLSLLLRGPEPKTSLSRRQFGHSKIQTTFDLYTQKDNDETRAAQQ